MLDDDYSLYNGIRSIYGEGIHFMLCNWHVEKNWKRHVNQCIKDEKTKEKIIQDLKHILQTENYQKLLRLILKFVTEYKKFPKLINYLKTYYFTNKRAKRWARSFWGFPHCKSDRNMFCESFHNVFKLKLERRCKRRIDDLVLCFEYVETDYFRKNIKSELVRQKIKEREKENKKYSFDFCKSVTVFDKESDVSENISEVNVGILENIAEECEIIENVSEFNSGKLENEVQKSEIIENVREVNAGKLENKVEESEIIENVSEVNVEKLEKWKKIKNYIKMLQGYVMDPDLDSVIDHLEGKVT